MAEAATKKCRSCQEDIPAKAKKCGKCGAKQGNWVVRHPVWTGIIALVILVVIVGGGSSDSTTKTDNTSSETTASSADAKPASATPAPIEYIKVSKDDLDAALKANAAAAKDTYNKKYVEATGKLGTIDSDLKYITIESATKDFDFTGLRCRIKDDTQKDIVKTLTKGQTLTVKGQVTDVGEVMGYSLDLTEIIP